MAASGYRSSSCTADTDGAVITGVCEEGVIGVTWEGREGGSSAARCVTVGEGEEKWNGGIVDGE